MVQGGIPPSGSAQVQATPACRSEKLIKAEVVLGVTSRNCQGHGICRIYTKGTIGVEKSYCHFTQVDIKRWGASQLSLRFRKEGMRRSTYRKFFRAGLFLVEEPALLPTFICRRLGNDRYVIPAGAYVTHDLGNSIEVIVPYINN